MANHKEACTGAKELRWIVYDIPYLLYVVDTLFKIHAAWGKARQPREAPTSVACSITIQIYPTDVFMLVTLVRVVRCGNKINVASPSSKSFL